MRRGGMRIVACGQLAAVLAVTLALVACDTVPERSLPAGKDSQAAPRAPGALPDAYKHPPP